MITVNSYIFKSSNRIVLLLDMSIPFKRSSNFQLFYKFTGRHYLTTSNFFTTFRLLLIVTKPVVDDVPLIVGDYLIIQC